VRIVITVDPYIPVPPLFYGGIERVVDFVARGLVARGHEITIFAHPESRVDGELIPYGVPPHTGLLPRLTELWQVGGDLWRRRHDFEAVISWGRLAALIPILPFRDLPKIQRYSRDSVPWRSVKIASSLAGDSLCFVGASSSVYQSNKTQEKYGGRWHTIFDGVELEKYTFVADIGHDAPLIFLGRLEPLKGAHTAIAVAKASNKSLIIAGNRVDSGSSAEYFDRELAPHIDGKQIKYVGPVNDQQKDALLGSATALLFPTQYEEAFGIVMAEAMACGTPVLASPRGSVPEVIREGVNGFVCRSVEEFVARVFESEGLNRTAVRMDCESRFSSSVVVDNFERLCVEMIKQR
jgi:glycosyltransferase involved in cell wall biosynthesis